MVSLLQEEMARTESAIKILWNLSYMRQAEVRSAIVHSDTVKAFTLLLSSEVDRLVFYSCAVLHNLLDDADLRRRGARDARALRRLRQEALGVVRENGGVLSLARLLARCADRNVQLTTVVVDTLRNLAHQHDPAKGALLAERIPHLLLHLLGGLTRDELTPSEERLVRRIMRLIKGYWHYVQYLL